MKKVFDDVITGSFSLIASIVLLLCFSFLISYIAAQTAFALVVWLCLVILFLHGGYWLAKKYTLGVLHKIAVGIWLFWSIVQGVVNFSELAGNVAKAEPSKLIGFLCSLSVLIAGIMIDIGFLSYGVIAGGALSAAVTVPRVADKGLPAPFVILAVFIFVFALTFLMRYWLRKKQILPKLLG